MARNLKTTLKYGFWLLVGVLLISIQVYKYFMDTLEFSTQEAAILLLGMMFMIKPTVIPDTLLKIFGKNKI
jgi:hypothetical protein